MHATVAEFPDGLLVLEPDRKNVHVRTKTTMDGIPAVAVLLGDNGEVTVQLRTGFAVNVIAVANPS